MQKQTLKLLATIGLATCISNIAFAQVIDPNDKVGNAIWVADETRYNFPDHVVALTFDDGPDLKSDQVYTYLQSQKISATFFVIGKQPGRTETSTYLSSGLVNYASKLPLLIAAKHRVANHTFKHTFGGETGSTEILNQINNLQALIDSSIKNSLYLIRAPHNYPGLESYNAMPGITRQFRDIERNYDTADWAYPAGPTGQPLPSTVSQVDAAAAAVKDLVTLIKNKNYRGGIIQMHDGNESNPGGTFCLEQVKQLVPLLKGQAATHASLQNMQMADPFVFAAPVLEFSESDLFTANNGDFSDTDGFGNDAGYYDTFRLADMNGDGKMDAVMRGASGIYVAYAYANGLGFAPKQLVYNLDFTDVVGWKNSKYASSIQYADVNNDRRMDIIARRSDGIVVAINNGNGFNATVNMSYKSSTYNNGIADFADADGGGKWGSDERWYSTIHAVDINQDGRVDIVGRSSQGIWIAYGTSTGFQQKKLAFTQNFYDSTNDGWNWGLVDRAGTIQYVDVNGDGWPDIVGRGIWGIMVALNTKISGNEFTGVSASWWTGDYRNTSNWNLLQYSKSVHFADINGDGMADVIGRGTEGLWVALSNGKRFTEARLWSADYQDAYGWSDPKYNSSLQYGDINGDGRADAAGRGANGIWVGLAP